MDRSISLLWRRAARDGSEIFTRASPQQDEVNAPAQEAVPIPQMVTSKDERQRRKEFEVLKAAACQ